MVNVNTSRVQFVIVCGLSFAGKSTLGKAIAERFGYAEVDVDETKMDLYGQHCKDENLNPEDWVRINAETDKLIETRLKSGKSVLDPSRNFSRTEQHSAKNIADKAGVPIVTVYVDTPEIITRQRLLENRRNPSRRDVSDEDFEYVLRAMEPPTAAENPLVFHHASDVDDWLLKNAAKLTPKKPRYE